jgi:hypothetical protein
VAAGDAVVIPGFDGFCADASVFWRANTLPSSADDPVILVEAMSQDLRVTVRNLTIANALRRIVPARLVVYTGSDTDWNDILWTYFDKDVLTRLARAYGAVDVIDVHELVDQRLSGAAPRELIVAGVRFPAELPRSAIAPEVLDRIVHATTCRVLRVPRLTPDQQAGPACQRIRDRSEQFSHLYDALVSGLRPVALVSSHVDYDHWGLAVESAQRLDVPVIHVQSTGGLKAYALFPDQRRGAETFRAELTVQIAEYFEKHVWPKRDLLRRSAEQVTWRSKGNLGRPSWWRGGNAAVLELRTAADRRVVRRHAMSRLGFDPDKPVVVVYNHAVSDALNTNVEVFDDLGAWFEQTAEYAAGRTDVSWLLVDHPQQALYDASGFFDRVAGRYAAYPQLAFRPSGQVSKNLVWSLADLALTVRGSVGNELPAYGIPVVQAGWSEWSGCGFARVARDVADYWRLLDDAIGALTSGRPLLSDEDIERARLWAWFYRSGTDVNSSLVQHWEMGQNAALFRALRVAMRNIEPDADGAFTAVRRMWTRREPFLTRFDLAQPEQALADLIGGPGAVDPCTVLERVR